LAFSELTTFNLSNNGLTVIGENALMGSRVRTVLLSNNQLRDLSAFAHVTFIVQPCERCDASPWLDLSNNPVGDLTPLLRATWPKTGFAKLSVTDGQIDCAAQASNVQALRALGVTVNGCP
jgi:Leucine-rich repeat (LRR) protein